MDDGLTPDIPLGPFEGTLITVYTAGKTARLHATRDCSRLRADHINETKVPLNAATFKQMCADCARENRWAPSETALGMYLRAVARYALPYDLDRDTEPDPDDCVTDEEIVDAAVALQRGLSLSADDASEDDEGTDNNPWEVFQAARELRDSAAQEWCSAAESLIRAASTVARYPWLKPWASKRLDLKSNYADVLRSQAAQLLNRNALLTASAAEQITMPDLPMSDPAFAVLGDMSDIRLALQGLWYDWHHQVSHGWLMPPDYSFYLTCKIVDRLGNKRKGRDQLSARSHDLLNAWADAALTRVTKAASHPDRLIVTTLRIPEMDHSGRRDSLNNQLSRWELGVLIVFMVAADWATRTFLLKVPPIIAERLLADHGTLQSTESPGDPEGAEAYESLLEASADERLAGAGHSAFLPGVLDDTPVSQRRVITLAEVRTLREVLDERRQIFLVCSVANGAEVLHLATVEERCKSGWTGILIAEAGDLPAALFGSHLTVTPDDSNNETDDALTPDWGSRYLTAENPRFGEQLGNEAGERRLRQMNSHVHDVRWLEHSFRILTLARGVHDLRSIDGESVNGLAAVPQDVWLALLLVRDNLNLQPFWPHDPEERRHGGLGLPLAVLADVQIYTTNADPTIMGKGHSPFCQHAHDRGIRHNDFLLTLEEVMRRTDLDWCRNCGGYAIRRLSDEQLSYYRVAHMLHSIDKALRLELAGNGSQQIDLVSAQSTFDEIHQWLYGDRDRWQVGDTWRIEEVLRELKGKADRLARYRRDGWPDSGSVVQFKPKR